MSTGTSGDARHSRSTLPMSQQQRPPLITYDAKDPDTAFPPIQPLRPPKGAPNVLVVLIDDVGFGASSAFGGPAHTPTAERLAAGGLRYVRFHTTALCSPTRQAMLTGRNHHSVGMGGITEIATSAPGYNSIRPKSKAPLAETLKLNGYSTAQFGKCHEVPVWETSLGEGRVDATVPMMFSADETTDVGNSATPASDDYTPKDSRFTGRVQWVQIDLDKDAEDADHLISPEERFHIAMVRQ